MVTHRQYPTGYGAYPTRYGLEPRRAAVAAGIHRVGSSPAAAMNEGWSTRDETMTP